MSMRRVHPTRVSTVNAVFLGPVAAGRGGLLLDRGRMWEDSDKDNLEMI